MATQQYKAWSVVTASTIAFTVCFMIWMMFAVIGIPIKKMLDLNETQFGILIATPVLTGSLIRLPLGMWTDKFGGRIVFFLLMLSTVIPIYLISQATEFWHFLVTGLFVGVAGGSFTVGISYCARWFPKNRQGTAMGIFGAGNTGAAITKLVAPAIVVAYGWAMVPQMYAVLMLVTAILFWFFSYSCPDHIVGKTVTVREQLAALKDPRVWRYSQYYSIVFGGYVALALWMTKYYITEYGFDLKTAALMAAAFSIPGGLLRAVGGYFSDKYGAHSITWWVIVGVPGLSVYPVLPADRNHHSYREWTYCLSRGSRSRRFHHHHVYPGHRFRNRQGFGIQVYLRRLSQEHRRDFRRGRSGGRPGRFFHAHHVRCAGGSDRYPFFRIHADVWRGVGFSDVDVLDRSEAA